MGCENTKTASEQVIDLTESLEVVEEIEQEELQESANTTIMVYVCGAVVTPGVYEVSTKDRVIEAIEQAGGMTEEADTTYLNLAETMIDGQKINVPTIEEGELLEKEQEATLSGLININRASKEELMTLAGIGEAKALDIIAYREAQGGFNSIEELMEISGIKEGVFEKIKDQIRIG